MTITSVSERQGLRERFIEDASALYKNRNLNFTQSKMPGQEGRFVDNEVHQLWLGYELFNISSNMRDKADSSTSIYGQYIVGNHTGPGPKLIMNRKPMVHRNKFLAYIEAERLAEEHGETFAVFRCIKTFSERPPVEDNLPG